jgi:hypothetical protein
MSKPVWIATEDGNLRHAKTDKLIEVKSFELVKGKRGEMIEVEKPNGGKKTVLRFMVDETAFSFGPKASGSQPASQPASKGSHNQRSALGPRPGPARLGRPLHHAYTRGSCGSSPCGS